MLRAWGLTPGQFGELDYAERIYIWSEWAAELDEFIQKAQQAQKR